VAESPEPFREFARDLILRLERLAHDLSKASADISTQTAEMSRRNDLAIAESRAYFERWDARFEASQQEIRARLDEIQQDGHAQRQALFSILDRLDGGGAAPAAG
jgi:hypothetical protein